MRLVILGGPGAGKGTQGAMLCNHLSIKGIAVGDVLREAIALQTNLGHKAQPYVEKGELVPDETMIEFIRQRLLKPDVMQGWLLDGYPRTAFQAEELDFLLDELGQKLSWAIYLNVSPTTLMNRSVGRSRPDDQPEIIQRRIELFHERTVPLLEYYEHCNRLLTCEGDRAPEEIHREILQRLSSNG